MMTQEACGAGVGSPTENVGVHEICICRPNPFTSIVRCLQCAVNSTHESRDSDHMFEFATSLLRSFAGLVSTRHCSGFSPSHRLIVDLARLQDDRFKKRWRAGVTGEEMAKAVKTEWHGCSL